MKKILALIFAFAMTFSLAACSGGNSAKTETIKDLVIGVSSEPGNLDPQGIGMSTGLTLTGSFIFDPLLTFNGETNEVEARIAQEWSWDDDTHLRIKILSRLITFASLISELCPRLITKQQAKMRSLQIRQRQQVLIWSRNG